MFKVRTLKSEVIITRDKFPDIKKRLKKYLTNDREAQESSSIFYLIKKFGWNAKINLKTGNIVKLDYFSDKWDRLSNSALLVLCKYIEPGGVIHIANDKDQRYWVYKFDGQWFKKSILTRVFVDLNSKEDVTSFFEQAVTAAVENGLSRKEMIETINEGLVAEYLDV